MVAIPPKGYAGIPGRYDRLCGPGDRRILVTVRPDLAAWKDIARPKEDDRRFGRNALLATLLLPIAFAAFAKIAMLSLWSAPLYTFLPAVLLSSPLVRMTREHAIRIAVVSIALACASLLLAPAIAAWALVRGYEQHGLYVRLAAAAVEKEWQATTQRPWWLHRSCSWTALRSTSPTSR